MPERVMWTALPNGLSGAEADRTMRLSVLVSPRLAIPGAASGVLGAFPDFGGAGEQNWPSRMRTATFALELDGQVVADGLQPGNQLEPKLWDALFTADTPVRSTARFRDYSRHQFLSYPARALRDQVQRFYATTALDSAESPPPLVVGKRSPLLAALDASGFGPPPEPDGPVVRLRAEVSPGSAQPHDVVADFKNFHKRPSRPGAPLPQTGDLAGLLDFHECVACLGDYPHLMRSLGLVIDLEVPASDVPVAAAARRLRVLPHRPPADPAVPPLDLSPTTGAVWDGDVFVAAPDPDPAPGAPGIRNGLLDMDGDRFELIDVDVDGAGHKLVNLRHNLDAVLSRAAADQPRTAALPALRSAGFSLVQDDRKNTFEARLATISHHQAILDGASPQTAVLSAEQLVRGYRVDVWDSHSETWHSLCARSGTYRFERIGEVRTIEDEGFVQLSAAGVPTEPGGPVEPPLLYLPESLLRWTGWSQVAPRPGLALPTGNDLATPPASSDNAAVTALRLQASFTASTGSLPKLRFGVGYRLRARAVDLAGNSRTLEDADDLPALPAAAPGRTYLRYEPVPSPLVVLRAALSPDTHPGESPDRLVIRSVNPDPGLDTVPSPDTTDRHVAPPRTTVALAEAHGAFDGPDGRLRGDAGTHRWIADRDAAHLDHDGAVPVAPTDQMSLPYLADVLARGAALRNVPGAPDGMVGTIDATGHLAYRPTQFPVGDGLGSVTQVAFGPSSDWPAMQPFRLVLREGTRPPDWDQQSRVLTVSLPKGEVAHVALSCRPDRADLDVLGVWDWMRRQVEAQAEGSGEPTKLQALCEDVGRLAEWVMAGGHWALTPARPLVLVHAVQQPLGRPVIEALSATRAIGDTAAGLEGTLRVHPSSTGRLELVGSWNEPSDSGTEPTPAQSAADELHLDRASADGTPYGEVSLGDRVVADYDSETGTIVTGPDRCPRHHFPDTRHRVVRYRAVAGSWFAEYFVRHAEVRLHDKDAAVLEPAGVTPHSETVRSADGATTYAPAEDGGGDYTIDCVAGTIARSDPSGIPDGQTVRVDFLPPVSRTGDETVVHVPSSARPAPPRVRYVVPAFEWRRQTGTNLLASHRHGMCLRVYLDGPWSSSGEGEQLAVLVAPRGLQPSEPLTRYVTRMADDPLRGYDGPRPDSTGGLAFTGAPDRGPDSPDGPLGLTLDELDPAPANRVHVHAYDVAYDADKRLWYCDIELLTAGRAPTFEPFVRLALARYQPHSVVENHPDAPGTARDVKLSRVVLADFVQLPADRSVLVTHGADAPNRLRVVVSGESYLRTAETGGPASIEVLVQEQQAGLTGDLAWIPAPEAVVEPTANDLTVPNAVLWRGSVTLPEDRDIADFRLLVLERDTLLSDDPSQPPRLLYADTLELASLGPPGPPAELTAASSANPAVFGQPVVITATVGGVVAPYGHVTFADGDRRLGSVPLADGTAVAGGTAVSLSLSDLTVGSHDITCSYSGTSGLGAGHGTVTQVVARAATRVNVTPRLEIHGTTPFRKPPGST
ncbi:Ig-like domain-containing protein [Streptomyces sp. Go40/10]|uniref:Ig-like domain-containing protein n=1 Tax=Streptomyces sp. Go40/10 TaxID=2825844 RepID=UPI001E2C1ACC|nr:Ig-like domain-containing protein [Streptomyces sp. Go40/10]UFR05971.1 Ig-like domain-containing protein [Streptomyces sp. Go40/10]